MRFVFALALLVPAAANAYEVASLPARASFSGAGQLCGSTALRNNLSARFWWIVAPDDSSDLQIKCEESPEALVLKVYARGQGLKFTVERNPQSSDDNIAFLAGSAVARDSEVIAAVLDAFLARNAALADAGNREFAASDWSDTVAHLGVGLESELSSAPIYFGLYRAHAELSHPIKAKWYLEAYLRASGLDPAKLTDEQVRPLLKAEASGAMDSDDADASFGEYQNLAAAHHWDAAFQKLREIVAAAPWYEPAYVSLAQSFDANGWKRLTKIWRARAVFVINVNKDTRLGKDIEARLESIR